MTTTTIREYAGTGQLTLVQGRVIECSFLIQQFEDGAIAAVCQLTSDNLFDAFELGFGEIKSLNGVLSNGGSVLFSGNLIMTRLTGQSVIIHGAHVETRASGQTQVPNVVRWMTQNFDCRQSPQAPQPVDGPNSKVLDISADDWPILELHRVSNYSEVIGPLKEEKGIAVTSEIRCAWDGSRTLDELIDYVNDVCTLLSFAQGCRIAWVCCDVQAADGKVIESRHIRAINGRFGNLSIISKTYPAEIAGFVTRAMPTFRTLNAKWKLRTVIDAITAAKQEGTFLESRALQIASVMELIKDSYLKMNDRMYIVSPPDEFEGLHSKISRVVKEALAEHEPTLSDEQQESIINHLQGLNWYPFRRAVREVCDEAGVRFRSKEIARFVEIRNNLVHQFSFMPGTQKPWDQFAYMMSFVCQIVLGILKYEGHFLDWSKPSSSESELRTEFPRPAESPGQTMPLVSAP